MTCKSAYAPGPIAPRRYVQKSSREHASHLAAIIPTLDHVNDAYPYMGAASTVVEFALEQAIFFVSMEIKGARSASSCFRVRAAHWSGVAGITPVRPSVGVDGLRVLDRCHETGAGAQRRALSRQ
jgi:hypothetical protein